MRDKYQERVKELEDRQSKRLFRKGVKKGKKQNLVLMSTRNMIKKYGREEGLGIARGVMIKAQKRGDVPAALWGARIYERWGKGNKPYVKNRLLDAYEEHLRLGETSVGDDGYIKEIESFLENNSREYGRGIEGKLSIVGLFFAGLLGVFLLSPNLTGNAIGNVSQGTLNLVGGILFFLAILGIIYFLRKNKFKKNKKN